MNISQDYDSKINYIGNSSWQIKYTNVIYRKLSGINYTSHKHDGYYDDLHQEHGIVMRILLKTLFDLIFLVMAFFRCLRNFQIYGCVISILLYLILFCHTPWYIKGMYKK